MINQLQVLKNIFLSKQQRLKNQQFQRAQSQRKFWLRLMNQCVRRRFLKTKQYQQIQCMKHDNLKDFTNCYKQEQTKMEKYMLEMQFYKNKYETCIQQGLKARYPLKNVESVCGNKMVKFIRANNDLL